MMNTRKISLVSMVMTLAAATQGCTAITATAVVAGGTGALIALDRRTTGSMLEDQAMEMKATDAIYGDVGVGKSVHVAVTSFNNIVLLTGEAPTLEARSRVVEIVREMSNSSVRVIHNEIRIEPTADIPARTRDTWVTSEAKSRLLVNVGVPTRTKVVTSGGNVYLMGLVTQDEAKRLAKIVADTRDVKSVVTVFEYLEGDSRILNATRGKAIVVEHGGSANAAASASASNAPAPSSTPSDGAVTIPLPATPSGTP
ncbi:MAG: BON domain-containing protein [Gammaproteobacteria bacterium]|nr:BON domain-containing protein [Gammaproteobacteria bacterium]